MSEDDGPGHLSIWKPARRNCLVVRQYGGYYRSQICVCHLLSVPQHAVSVERLFSIVVSRKSCSSAHRFTLDSTVEANVFGSKTNIERW